MFFLILFIMLMIALVVFSVMRCFDCDVMHIIANLTIVAAAFLIPLACSLAYTVQVEATIVLMIVLTLIFSVVFNLSYVCYKDSQR